MPAKNIRAWLKPGRDKPSAHRHPWVFSGAIARWEQHPVIGSVVDVLAHDGRFLGRGFAHPTADLAVRLFTFREDEPLDDELLARRMETAVSLRERIFRDAHTNAFRLVFSESDELPGLIVDRYADALSVQVGAAALADHLPGLLKRLRERTGVARVRVAADRDAVAREQLDAARVESLSSLSPGAATAEIQDGGLRFEVSLAEGQKTGFYLDQRDNRKRVAAYAAGRRVLSCYCYTGAFEMHAARAGASEILGLDSSEPALAQARRHAELNGVSIPIEYRAADVPSALRTFRDEARSFDLIILDPPRFVFNTAQKAKGLRAYKDINLLALKLLAPGGFLATFSCSGLVTHEDLKQVVRWAAKDSGRTVQMIETLGQPPDHPVLATFPESEYLSGLVVSAH